MPWFWRQRVSLGSSLIWLDPVALEARGSACLCFPQSACHHPHLSSTWVPRTEWGPHVCAASIYLLSHCPLGDNILYALSHHFHWIKHGNMCAGFLSSFSSSWTFSTSHYKWPSLCTLFWWVCQGPQNQKWFHSSLSFCLLAQGLAQSKTKWTMTW